MASEDMEKSRIPVYSSAGSETVGKRILADFHLIGLQKKSCPPKPVIPEFSSNANFNFASNCPEAGTFKAQKSASNVRSKTTTVSKAPTVATRGPISRYRAELALKDRNQLLEAANQELNSKVATSQKKLHQLTTEKEKLNDDIQELKQHLESLMVILETKNIDPVTGTQILDTVKENNQIRSNVQELAISLMTELKNFSNMATEHTNKLQEFKSKCIKAKEERQLFLQEMNAYQLELEQLQKDQDEVEKLLEI